MAKMAPKAAEKAKTSSADLKTKWESALANGLIVKNVGTNEAYQELVAAVKVSTEKNENQAALVDRIKALGKGVVSLAKVLTLI